MMQKVHHSSQPVWALIATRVRSRSAGAGRCSRGSRRTLGTAVTSSARRSLASLSTTRSTPGMARTASGSATAKQPVTTTVAWGLASAVSRMSRREDAVDSAVTVQVLITTTSGASPAWARSKPRAPSASRACSLSAWLRRHPRVLKATVGLATVGLWTAGAAPSRVGLPSRIGGPGIGGSGSAIAERLHQRGLGRVVGVGGGVDADVAGVGEHLPPGVPVGEHPAVVVVLGPVLAKRPPDGLGRRRGVDPAGELVVGGAPRPEGVLLPRQLEADVAAELPVPLQERRGHAPVVEAGL